MSESILGGAGSESQAAVVDSVTGGPSVDTQAAGSDAPQVNATVDSSAESTVESGAAPQVDWKAGVSEEYAANKTIKSLLDGSESLEAFTEGLTKQLYNVESLIGGDKAVLPNENSTAEQIQEFHEKIGKPDSAEGYKFEYEHPQGRVRDEKLDSVLRDTFFESHVSGEAAEKVYAAINDHLQELDRAAIEGINNKSAEQLEALKNEWGMKYDDNLAEANRAVEALITEDNQGVIDKLKMFNLTNDPDVIKWFNGIYNTMLKEDSAVPSESATSSFKMTPAEAQNELNKMTGDKNHPIWKGKQHPHYKAANKRKQELQGIINNRPM